MMFLDGDLKGMIRTLLLEGYWKGLIRMGIGRDIDWKGWKGHRLEGTATESFGSGRQLEGDWKNPDVVAERQLEGLDPDGEWKGN